MLPREEYVEQAYFFRRLVERLGDNQPMQDLLDALREEVLSTTKLPLAIGFMLDELKHHGTFGTAMARLGHYFTPFQTFVIAEAEQERGRFDLRIALDVLRRQAEYLAQGITPQGLFLYQFECLCRNRLSYDRGLAAMADDPAYSGQWREWILTVRRQVGLVDLADLIYVRSACYRQRQESAGDSAERERPMLFGVKEGRIALANRHKNPLLLFSALQRQLGYPAVPRPKPFDTTETIVPQLARRMERLEARIKLIEEEQRGGIDITKFYGQAPPPS